MTFSQPSAGGDQFDAKDYNGRLLIVFPKSFSAETPTIHGTGPSADVDIVVVDAVDATGKPLYFQNARLFGNLAKSVSRDLGGQVLGRLGQVPTQRGNPAWVLQNFTDQDAAMAGPALTAYQQGLFKQAENPMAPASATPQAPQAYSGVASPAPVAQQWQGAAAATPAPSYAAPAAPAQQQWTPPPVQPAAPSAVVPTAAPTAADPALLAHLARFGINLPPTTPQAQAEAVAATLPQQ